MRDQLAMFDFWPTGPPYVCVVERCLRGHSHFVFSEKRIEISVVLTALYLHTIDPGVVNVVSAPVGFSNEPVRLRRLTLYTQVSEVVLLDLLDLTGVDGAEAFLANPTIPRFRHVVHALASKWKREHRDITWRLLKRPSWYSRVGDVVVAPHSLRKYAAFLLHLDGGKPKHNPLVGRPEEQLVHLTQEQSRILEHLSFAMDDHTKQACMAMREVALQLFEAFGITGGIRQLVAEVGPCFFDNQHRCLTSIHKTSLKTWTRHGTLYGTRQQWIASCNRQLRRERQRSPNSDTNAV